MAADGADVALRPKSFTLLRYLAENAGRLIGREELMRVVWPGVFVTEDSLIQCVMEVRRALGDDERRLLRTVPRRGYLFAAQVSRAAAAPPATAPTHAPPRIDRPVVVVLPFTNMTGEQTQEHLADGITEDLTTALSHARWFSVIARNSAFTYKGRAVDVRQVGRELGAGYALEGSVRTAGSRVRVTAQLCSTEGGQHVWARSFDGDLTDLFAFHDGITAAIVSTVEPSLRLAEAERSRSKPTDSLGAYDLYLRALPQRYLARADNDAALRMLRRAVALDPSFSAAKGNLAGLICVRVTQGWAETGEAAEALRCAREVAETDSEDDPTALAWAAHALTYLGRDYDAGLDASERAVSLAPNAALVLLFHGWNRLYAGDWRTALVEIERAMRLSPVDPAMFYFTIARCGAHFVAGHHGEAASWARRTIRLRPGYLIAHRLLAASLVALGEREAAREAVHALLTLAPGDTVASVAAKSALRGEARKRYLAGLSEAGLPD